MEDGNKDAVPIRVESVEYQTAKLDLIKFIDGAETRIQEHLDRSQQSKHPTDWIDGFRNAATSIPIMISMFIMNNEQSLNPDKISDLNKLKVDLMNKPEVISKRIGGGGEHTTDEEKEELLKLLKDIKELL